MNRRRLARQGWMAHPDCLLRFVVLFVLASVFVSGVLLHCFGVDVLDHLPAGTLCPFHAVTGHPCPGCGMTRAMVCLGQLRFGEALAFNPFSILLMSAMVLYLALGKGASSLQHERVSRSLLFAVLVFWIHRLMNT